MNGNKPIDTNLEKVLWMAPDSGYSDVYVTEGATRIDVDNEKAMEAYLRLNLHYNANQLRPDREQYLVLGCLVTGISHARPIGKTGRDFAIVIQYEPAYQNGFPVVAKDLGLPLPQEPSQTTEDPEFRTNEELGSERKK